MEANGSLRFRILAAKDLKEERVEVPEWGVGVLLRGFTGRQRAHFAAEFGGVDIDLSKAYADLLIAGAYDPDTGLPLFTDAERDQIIDKSGEVLERLSGHILRLSGLAPGSLLSAEKNSSAANDASISSLPGKSAVQ